MYSNGNSGGGWPRNPQVNGSLGSGGGSARGGTGSGNGSSGRGDGGSGRGDGGRGDGGNGGRMGSPQTGPGASPAGTRLTPTMRTTPTQQQLRGSIYGSGGHNRTLSVGNSPSRAGIHQGGGGGGGSGGSGGASQRRRDSPGKGTAIGSSLATIGSSSSSSMIGKARPILLPSGSSSHAPGSSQNPIPISTPSPPPSTHSINVPPPPPIPARQTTAHSSVSSGTHAAAGSSQTFGKLPRVDSPSSSTLDNHTAYLNMLEDEEMDYELAQQVIDLTQSNDRDEFVPLGHFDKSVVGVRYYNGVITTGEAVLLIREPNNQYDSNAIRVCNVARQQVGHLPRAVAAALAPLMDMRLLKLEGTVTGPKEVYELPIRVDVYATSSNRTTHEQIYNALRRGSCRVNGMPSSANGLLSQSSKRKADIGAAAASKRSRGMATLAAPGPSYGGNSRGIDVMAPFEITGYNYRPGGQPLGPLNHMPLLPGAFSPPVAPRLSDLVQGSERFNPREIGSIVQKFGMGEDVLEKMPLATQPNRLSISLLPYQLQGLKWLLDHEFPVLPKKPHEVVQFWKLTRNKQFINVTTNFVQPKPELSSGGILADDMGLGKTVQMISLIIADLEKNGPRNPGSGGTLVVAPLSVMSNWKDQIARHVKSDSPLTVSVFHGAGKHGKTDLKNYDVVITSYGTLTSEYDSHQSKKSSPLYGLNWRRVILDEGHQIRNPKTKSSIASTAISAQSRWALTGTPIVNNLKDLYSLVRFLKFSGGLSEYEVFYRTFIRPLSSGTQEGSERLQALMATICLRRTKEMKFVNIGLPELKEYVHRVKFTREEKSLYDVLKAQAEGILDRYVKGKTASGNSSSDAISLDSQNGGSGSGQPASDDYRCLLEFLLRMRQMCNHPMLCGADRVKDIEARLAEIAGGGLSDEVRGLLQEILQLAIDSQEDCAICLETLHNPRITICRHVFGAECITRVIEESHKCPMCRNDLKDTTSATLVEPYLEAKPPPMPMTLEDGTSVPPPSSKIEALIAILNATRTNDPTNKTIIFSQWTKYLDLISPHLVHAGLRFCRIDGTMRVNQRDVAISRLSLPEDDPQAVDVMLASLGVASVGLNLVAANQVILADSWWAPAIEDQAVDRVHRLGQKRETTVWRLVVEDSIEEKVLKIQEKKRELVGRAFREEETEEADGSSSGGNKKGKRGQGRVTRLADLQMLLSRAPASQNA